MSACNMYSNGKLIQTFHFRGDQTFYIDSFGNISFGKYRLCKTCHKFHKGICWYTPKGYKLLANKRKFMKKKIQIAKISCSKEQTVIYTPEKKQLENNLSLNSNNYNKSYSGNFAMTYCVEKGVYICPNCNESFTNRSDISKHTCNIEKYSTFCHCCGENYETKKEYNLHLSQKHAISTSFEVEN
ncbi:uncharacterized protein LOC126902677 isoform X2 [Daktulosphaira vitifoliae]|uniref:uncharacterized protein LOC126902677 isoform X2 n=1 Tax=Daktulosphaira vitifoliae TaxID=58002 RepID=UPI0021AADD24|nr:uncharacterized protein LOC126902677 isoform X2 [Daktulosphaira vitifoliae]